MPSVIIAACPAHGHVTPLLTVARGFVERGDDVRFITGTAFADRVTATGATHIALPPEAEVDFDDLEATFPERAGLKGMRAVTFDVEHVFANAAKPQYEAVLAAHTAQAADVVLAEPAFFGAAFLLAHHRPTRPAVVMCGVLPLMIPSTDTAPFGMGLPPVRLLNRQRNAILAALNRRVWAAADDTLDRLHRAVHGEALPGPMLNCARADAIVQFTVPSFEYPRSDAPPSSTSSTSTSAPLVTLPRRLPQTSTGKIQPFLLRQQRDAEPSVRTQWAEKGVRNGRYDTAIRVRPCPWLIPKPWGQNGAKPPKRMLQSIRGFWPVARC